MSRSAKYQLMTTNQRKSIKPDNDPYWIKLYKGLSLGFRRAPGTRHETWTARMRSGGKYAYHALGAVTADFDYKQAERAAKDWEADKQSGKADIRKPNKLTIRELMDDYITKTAPKKSADWQYQSMRRAKAYVYAYDIADFTLSELTAPDIEDLQDELRARMTAESVNRNLAGLRAALNWAHRRGIVSDTPWKRVPLCKEASKHDKKRSKKYFNQDERGAFIKAAPAELAAICTYMYYTGCRPSEARRLRVKDVSLAHNQVMLGTLKGDDNENYKYRQFMLWPELAEFLAKQIAGKEETDFVFLTPKEQPWGMANLGKAIRSCREANGLDDAWESYCFRHGTLTDWVNSGIPTMNVAQIAGTSTKYLEENYHKGDASLADKLAAAL